MYIAFYYKNTNESFVFSETSGKDAEYSEDPALQVLRSGDLAKRMRSA